MYISKDMIGRCFNVRRAPWVGEEGGRGFGLVIALFQISKQKNLILRDTIRSRNMHQPF